MYSLEQIIRAQFYLNKSNISYKHVCENTPVGLEEDYIASDCFGLIHKLTGGKVAQILEQTYEGVELEYLFLRDLGLEDLVPFSHFTEVKIIDSFNNRIDSLVSLKSFHDLKEAYFGNNLIHNIRPLENLPIEKLDLSDNKIDDIFTLRSLSKLTSLHLGGNNITDISALVGLPNLKILDLSGNDLREIQQLADHLSLVELYLYYTNISHKELIQLCKKLSYCKIHYDDIVSQTHGTLRLYKEQLYLVNHEWCRQGWFSIELVAITDNPPPLATEMEEYLELISLEPECKPYTNNTVLDLSSVGNRLVAKYMQSFQ